MPKHTTHTILTLGSATLTKQIAHYNHEIKITRNSYFSLNHRRIQITLAQIRLELSNLNKHLFVKGCLNSSQCEYTEAVETLSHYFLKCKLHNIHRPIMMQTLTLLSLNLPLSSSSTTSRKLLSQFPTCSG